MRERLRDIKSKISNFFKNNMVQKVMSVVLAVVVWFVIISLTNPIEPLRKLEGQIAFTIDKLEDPIVNDGKTFDIREGNSVSVNCYISGRQEALDNTTLENIQIELDEESLKKVTQSGEHDIDLSVTCNKLGVSVEKFETDSITLYFDEIVTETFAVNVITAQSIFDENFVEARTTATPSDVTVRGFKSVIDRVETVQVRVDSVSQKINKDSTVKRVCSFLDNTGNEITDLTTQEVEVYIQAGKSVKVNLTDDTVIGSPDSSVYLKGAPSLNSDTVTLVGDIEQLNAINSLDIEQISIAGLTAFNSTPVTLILPNGVSVANPNLIPVISIPFGKYQDKTLAINVNDIERTNVDDKYTYELESIDTDEIIINGKDVEVAAVTSVRTLAPRINCRGLTEGVHDVQITFSGIMPTGVRIDSVVRGRVIVKAVPVETSPPPTTQVPTDSPTPTPTAPSQTPDATINPQDAIA